MKVPHVEVLAKHSGPESCGGHGNMAAEALTGENAGGLLSSEITAFRVPTLWSEGEGDICHSVIASCGRTRAESKNLACAEAFCTRIGRPVNPPVSKSWNGRIQPVKISWCVGWRPFPSQAMNTKSGRKYRMGEERIKSATLSHKVPRESDNNIVPEKRANKRKYRPQRSPWREGR
jgi:hypothetical protein